MMKFFLTISFLFFLQCGQNVPNKVIAVNNLQNSDNNISSGKNMTTADNNLDKIASDISLKIESDYIEVVYKLTNNTGNSYLIFNQGDTNKGLGKGKVYVEPLPDGIVELSQKRFFKPADKSCPNYEVPVEAGASWLRPKESVTQTLKIGLPLKTFSPFDACTPKPELPQEIKKIKFCLGIAQADSSKVQINENGFVDNFKDVGEQKFLCSKEIVFTPSK